jgi:PAS domain S-box-containing protein
MQVLIKATHALFLGWTQYRKFYNKTAAMAELENEAMDTMTQRQIFYELAMSIGNSLDLDKVLQDGLSAYLEKLNCSVGIILKMQTGSDCGPVFTPIFSIPENLDFSDYRAAFERIPNGPTESSTQDFLHTLPFSVKDDKGRFCHIMELPGFGLLLLVRNGEALSPAIILSLVSLNQKLADSCLACLQNTKFQLVNKQLMHEIMECRQAEAELKKIRGQLEERVEERTRELKASIEALIGVNRQLNDIIEFYPDPTFVIDRDGEVVAWNRALEEITGVSKENMMSCGDYARAIPASGQTRPCLVDMLDESDDEIAASYPSVKRRAGGSLTTEAYVRWLRGGLGGYVFATAAPLFDANGRRTGAIESIRDITEQKEMERSLRRSEEKYREVVENANSIILRRDRAGNVTFFNEFAQRFFGFSEQEILGKNVVGTIVPAVESGSDRDLRQMIEDIGQNPGCYASNENENMRRNGERVWIAWTNKPILDQNSEVIEVLSVGNDITERKKAEDELFSSRQMLQTVLDNIPQRVFWMDREMSLVGCNKPYAIDRGFKAPSELIGLPTYEIHKSDEKLKRHRADTREVMETGRAKLRYEELLIKLDGSQAWIITSKSPLFDRDGRVVGVLGTYDDITERKQAEMALRESEERFRSVIENMQDVFYRTDENGVITMMSPSATELLGVNSLAEVLGAKPESFWMCPKQRSEMIELIRQNGAVRDHEAILRKKDGSPVFVSSSSRFRKDENGKFIGMEGVIRDISERKRAEEEHTRLVTAIEQSPEAIIVSDLDFIIHYVNPAFTSISGYESTEVIGQHLGLLKSDLHDRDFYRQIKKTLAAGGVWSGRLTARKKEGSFYEVEASGSPVRNSAGVVINYVIIHRDITRQVKLEKDLRQAQKMEAIGTLAGGIAHDFNNILAAIIGFTEIAKFRLGPDDPARRNLDQVLKASARAADLVKRILAFSRQGEQKRQAVPIVSIVKEALKLLRPALPTTIEICSEIALSPEEGVVFADPTEIHQVLMNLCTNAAHAMRSKGGTLLVGLSLVTLRDCPDPLHPDLGAGVYVRLSVSDTGPGIDPAVMERIFDPYFTTKAVGEGTGLGLSVVQGIARGYGGTVRAHNEHGKGARFEVFFPGMNKEASISAETSATLPSGAERILFVDDERDLVDLGKELLESLGYKVVAEKGSLEALESLRADPYGFDIVITDMTMPGMNGKELAREVLALRPEMPVILCTGHSEIIDDKLAKEMGITAFVMKPYNAANFAATIRKTLQKI